MEKPSKKQLALLVSTVENDGRVVVSLDDVVLELPDGLWRHDYHFTNKSYSAEEFRGGALEREAEDFGHHIIARLSAYRAVAERAPALGKGMEGAVSDLGANPTEAADGTQLTSSATTFLRLINGACGLHDRAAQLANELFEGDELRTVRRELGRLITHADGAIIPILRRHYPDIPGYLPLPAVGNQSAVQSANLEADCKPDERD